MYLQRQIELAVSGDPYQEYNLGIRYLYGDEVVKSIETALMLFEKSANHGNACAQFKLGMHFYYGWGVEKNYKIAEKWFSLAADKGDTWAQLYCALLNRQTFLHHI